MKAYDIEFLAGGARLPMGAKCIDYFTITRTMIKTPYFKKITSNKKLRHFTLWFEDGAKFRTYPMSKEEFEVAEFNTENDWKQFLKSDGYYPV